MPFVGKESSEQREKQDKRTKRFVSVTYHGNTKELSSFLSRVPSSSVDFRSLVDRRSMLSILKVERTRYRPAKPRSEHKCTHSDGNSWRLSLQLISVSILLSTFRSRGRSGFHR